MEDFIKTKKADVDLSFLAGCTIKQAGFLPRFEGGLTIDYVNLEGEEKRLIFGYNELGTWLESNGDLDNSEFKRMSSHFLDMFKEISIISEERDVLFEETGAFEHKEDKIVIIIDNLDPDSSDNCIQYTFFKEDFDKLTQSVRGYTWGHVDNFLNFYFFLIDLEIKYKNYA